MILIVFIMLKAFCQPPFILETKISELLQNETTKEYMYSCNIIEENNIRYAFYCCDLYEKRIYDHICLRIGTKKEGKWKFGNETIVLNPKEYKVRHFCDPSVVRGKFSFKNEEYKYIMTLTYTINDLDRGLNNKVGISVSNDLLKWKFTNITLIDCEIKDVWGVGQPSMTCVDENTILLFYTRGDKSTRMIRQKINLKDISNPIYYGEILLPTKGLYQKNKDPQNSLFNGGIAYDYYEKVFFLVHSGLPFPKTEPSYIANYIQIAYIDEDDIWSPKTTSKWKVVDNIKLGNFDRTHNARFINNPYGARINKDNLEYTVSVSIEGEQSVSLWSYRIWLVYEVFRGDFNYTKFLPQYYPVRELK